MYIDDKEYNRLKLEIVQLKKELMQLKASEQRAARELVDVRCFELDGTLSKAY